jgi:putative sterol carrier protein
MAKFLSEKWLKECRKTLQDSEEFKSEARDFSGDFIFSFEADDELAKTKRLFLSIQGGSCEEAVFLNGEPYPDADYRISAPYSLWMRMIRGEEDALAAFTSRKVKVKGNMLRLMMNSGSAIALVKALAGVPIDFN